MTVPLVLQGGRSRRGRRPARRGRRRRRSRPVLRPLAFVIGTIVIAAAALLGFMAPRALGPIRVATHAAHRAPVHHGPPPPPPKSSYATQLAPPAQRVNVRLKLPLKSGILFDVDTGQVLWEDNPSQQVPIASLTKMMTALVVVAHAPPTAPVLITPDAIHFTGSGVGLLPLGKHIPLETLLYGLLLPSGNDAAIALAEHVGKTQPRFIALMNDRATQLGLRCSRFDTVSGIVDQGNYSCATDLATLAHAVLLDPRLAPIVASRSAVLPFPIKGGKLYLYNNNPLLVTRYPGTDGVKTGFTDAAGPCLVAAAKRGHTWLGVVLLHSGNPEDQAETLLNAGFAKAS